MAMKLAYILATAVPADENVKYLVSGRYLRKHMARQGKKYRKLDNHEGEGASRPMRQAEWERRMSRGKPHWRDTLIGHMAAHTRTHILSLCKKQEFSEAHAQMPLLNLLFMAYDHEERDRIVMEYAREIYLATRSDLSPYGRASDLRDKALEFLLLVKDTSCQEQMALLEKLKLQIVEQNAYKSRWSSVDKALRRMRFERSNAESDDFDSIRIHARDDTIQYSESWEDDEVTLGTVEAARQLLAKLVEGASFGETAVCGAPLYAAIPEPRRFPLANFICKYHRDLFDMLVLDEAHEYSNDGSAQERAAHRLSELGKPTLILTGTSNNGYASSLFMNMWALSRRFRAEFGREEIQEFVTRYGYRKVRVQPEDGKVFPSNYGVHSDRVDTKVSLKMHKIGQAPGVMPLFILKHLLTVAVTIHKSDLDVELPPLVEYEATIETDDENSKELVKQYQVLRKELIEAIMNDLQNEDLAGKLWGQMAQLPTYLDRAHEDTGNREAAYRRHYAIAYPESVGGEIVVEAKPFPADVIMPKEEWLIGTVRSELAEKRPVLVFVVNTRSGLSERLHRILKAAIGNRVAILNPRVKAAKRQEWIDKQVIAKGMQVLIANPKAVETGLNNLTYFCTSIWFQNPGCSPVIYRQANGRTHRPGQKSDEVRVYVPYYADTTQELQFLLLGHKIAASQQTDGLDVSSALLAAGAKDGDVGLDAMAVGQAIYKLLTERNGHRPKNSHFRKRPRELATMKLEPIQEAPALPGNGKQMGLLDDFEDAPAVGQQLKLLERTPMYLMGRIR